MSLRERFRLEDLENEGLGAKRIFPHKNEEAQAPVIMTTNCEEEVISENVKS